MNLRMISFARLSCFLIGCHKLSEQAVSRDFRYFAETADIVDTKIFWNTQQQSLINATLFPTQHIIPFSH